MAMKRKRHEEVDIAKTEGGVSHRTTKRRSHTRGDAVVASDTSQIVETPTKPRRGRPPGSSQKPKHSPNGIGLTTDLKGPSTLKRKSLFSTPRRTSSYANEETGAPIVRNADRLARRKSARSLIEPTATDGLSEKEHFEGEDLLARAIWEADGEESGEEQDEIDNEAAAEPATPSKRKRSSEKKSLILPPDLPPHEQYFWQTRPGKIKTSSSILSSLSLVNHEQYHNQICAYEDPHESSHEYLHAIHSRAFPQWRFELSQSFNICLYGYGSKRKLVSAFANYLYSLCPGKPPRILMVNGYNQTLTPQKLLATLAALIFDCTPSTLPPN